MKTLEMMKCISVNRGFLGKRTTQDNICNATMEVTHNGYFIMRRSNGIRMSLDDLNLNDEWEIIKIDAWGRRGGMV